MKLGSDQLSESGALNERDAVPGAAISFQEQASGPGLVATHLSAQVQSFIALNVEPVYELKEWER
jgi:hypothetical protein